MPTQFRQAIVTLALTVVSGTLIAGPTAAQTYIAPEPVETRTFVREPLNLTPAQRTTIYRTIVPQGRGKQPIIKERVVTETVGPNAPVRERVVTRPAAVEYVVGDRIAADVRLVDVPEQVVTQVPAVGRYRYMVVNDQLLLVDPVTSTVVEQIRP